jgi:hypothetical protein
MVGEDEQPVASYLLRLESIAPGLGLMGSYLLHAFGAPAGFHSSVPLLN